VYDRAVSPEVATHIFNSDLNVADWSITRSFVRRFRSSGPSVSNIQDPLVSKAEAAGNVRGENSEEVLDEYVNPGRE
jgi:hypothetical protein